MWVAMSWPAVLTLRCRPSSASSHIGVAAPAQRVFLSALSWLGLCHRLWTGLRTLRALHTLNPSPHHHFPPRRSTPRARSFASPWCPFHERQSRPSSRICPWLLLASPHPGGPRIVASAPRPGSVTTSRHSARRSRILPSLPLGMDILFDPRFLVPPIIG
ncbi:hypothetical protein K438DRAFT_2020582, partial [Mycena galopus ATCC 62051]